MHISVLSRKLQLYEQLYFPFCGKCPLNEEIKFCGKFLGECCRVRTQNSTKCPKGADFRLVWIIVSYLSTKYPFYTPSLSFSRIFLEFSVGTNLTYLDF